MPGKHSTAELQSLLALLCFYFKTWSRYVAQAGFTLQIVLSRPPQKLESQACATTTGLALGHTVGLKITFVTRILIKERKGRKETESKRERGRAPIRCCDE